MSERNQIVVTLEDVKSAGEAELVAMLEGSIGENCSLRAIMPAMFNEYLTRVIQRLRQQMGVSDHD